MTKHVVLTKTLSIDESCRYGEVCLFETKFPFSKLVNIPVNDIPAVIIALQAMYDKAMKEHQSGP